MIFAGSCYECGGAIDKVRDDYRYMNVLHEDSADPHDTMTIRAHERCIIGSPNEKNWEHAFTVTNKENN